MLDAIYIRGFALSDPFAPLIFINGAEPKAAQMFTLTHELAHLWLRVSALSNMEASKLGPECGRSFRREEVWCNAVALEFLLRGPLSAPNLPTWMATSHRFACALVASTLEAPTLYRDAFQMLGVSKTKTFNELGRAAGVIG